MKFKVFVLSLCIFAGVNVANAQDNKHEIRVSVSDGLTQSMVDVLGLGLADAVTGSKRTDEKASIVYGLGYRYAIGRFRVGTDIGSGLDDNFITTRIDGADGDEIVRELAFVCRCRYKTLVAGKHYMLYR